MRYKIKCPNCGRILGDTDRSLDCRFNCRGCKETVSVKVRIAPSFDYLTNKGDTNDKSE